MLDILQLDRSLWTYHATTGGAILSHPSCPVMRITGNGDTWMVHTGSHQEFRLECHRSSRLLGTPDRWDVLWAQLDAAAGPQAQAAVVRVYAFIRKMAVLHGYQGSMCVERVGDCPRWTFAPEPHAAGIATCADVFGPHAPDVAAALATIEKISASEYYTGEHQSGFWSHFNTFTWNVRFTLHERLQLMQSVERHGLLEL